MIPDELRQMPEDIASAFNTLFPLGFNHERYGFAAVREIVMVEVFKRWSKKLDRALSKGNVQSIASLAVCLAYGSRYLLAAIGVSDSDNDPLMQGVRDGWSDGTLAVGACLDSIVKHRMTEEEWNAYLDNLTQEPSATPVPDPSDPSDPSESSIDDIPDLNSEQSSTG